MRMIPKRKLWLPSDGTACLASVAISARSSTIASSNSCFSLEGLVSSNLRSKVPLYFSSDYFDELYEHCVKIIEQGNAYADDTEKETMAAQALLGQSTEILARIHQRRPSGVPFFISSR
jgi:hypothetical protein